MSTEFVKNITDLREEKEDDGKRSKSLFRFDGIDETGVRWTDIRERLGGSFTLRKLNFLRDTPEIITIKVSKSLGQERFLSIYTINRHTTRTRFRNSSVSFPFCFILAIVTRETDTTRMQIVGRFVGNILQF